MDWECKKGDSVPLLMPLGLLQIRKNLEYTAEPDVWHGISQICTASETTLSVQTFIDFRSFSATYKHHTTELDTFFTKRMDL